MATYKTPDDVASDMFADFKDITGETLDPNDLSREEVIKIKTYAGAISHWYSALQRVEDDIFPASASVVGLRLHLAERELPDQIQPAPAQGIVQRTGTTGTVIPQGDQIKNNATGAIYVSLVAGTIDSNGQVLIPYESLVAGQAYNIASTGAAFTGLSSITGVDSACTSTSAFSDGRDLEAAEEMLARIEEFDQNQDTGGNLRAYERFAKEASTLVVTATAIKNPRGTNTVNTVITSGTTDIESAVNNGQDVVRIPSSDLLTTVQSYIVDNNPTTDDHQTVGPTELSFDVTITYALFDETLRSSVDDVIDKLTKIYIYEAYPNQVLYPTDLERKIDANVGHLIAYRRVSDFSGSGPTYTVPAANILKPGTITKQGLS